MNNFLEGLPGSVKLAAIILSGGLVIFSGLKTGAINFSNNPTPTPTPTSTPSPLIETINIRLNIRDGNTKDSIPNAKAELIYLSGPVIEYTDSAGFIDIKVPKTNTTRLFITKVGYQALDRQLDPSLNISQDRNITLYLSPAKKDESVTTPPESPKPESLKPGSPKSDPSSPLSSGKPDKISPEDFMKSFYRKINERELNDAWLMLSEKRRNKQEKGFQSFREWWGEKVEKVNLENTKLIREDANSAEIEVMTSYIINQKKVDEKPIVFRLAMNPARRSWEILAKDE
jgi:hypothetical protein